MWGAIFPQGSIKNGKIALVTTPFNLSFGMKLVLPMNFLIPTLKGACTLEWMGYEILQRLEDMEKLNETRLMALGHMYAQKCMKQYHANVP